MNIASGAADDVTPPRLEIKGSKVRWDLAVTGSANGYRIYDGDKRVLYTIAPATQSLVLTRFPPASAPPSPGEVPWTFSVIDRVGRVADVPCERWRASGPDGASYELCVARGFPSVPLEFVITGAVTVAPFLPQIERDGWFPLVVMSRADVGRPDAGPARRSLGALRALSVVRAHVDDARFVVPPYSAVESAQVAPLRPAQH